ncbi:peptide/nickel transporter substrate-binding protein [Spongiactinospora gelatinilytica]|uniref:Peptide/nickel transporter substrate-binding protein n=1 Tax=Spongiactinospora gelatinilytica TaxID=2666298 RepID=A0A2W2GTD2_9ACTN|nr:ABC transporter substrate-binding protein [Spongiactinospora gelatinilytica]PZG52866.1 peptide/nickel transporter substrate-binding protein [Spongiactinospora gelatinilytica]
MNVLNSRPRRLRAGLAAAVTAGVLLLAGCGGGAAPSANTAADAGPPVRGGNLIVAVPTDPQSLDMVANPGQVTAHIGNLLYEKLFEVDKEFAARPMLVETYETSSDRLTYTFELRKGVTFHDGSPLTAEDVVASLQRWLKSHVTGQQVAPDVVTLKAKGDDTVLLKLKEPRYPLIDELASPGAEIYAAKNLEGVPATGFTDKGAIGTGPYKLASWDIGRQVVLERYGNYKSRADQDWGGQAGAKQAYLDTITYKVVADQDALVNGLQTGQWQHAMPGNDQYTALKENASIVVGNVAGANQNVIIPNHAKGSKFADVRARQALNLLMDKPAMNAATGGGPDLTAAVGAMVSEDNPALYSTVGDEVYKQHDPAKAKELFAQAGVKAGDTVRIVTSNSYPQFAQWAVLLQDQLAQIDIKTKIDTYDFPTMLGTINKDPGGWDLTTLFFNAALTSPSQMPAVTLGAFNGSASPEIAALVREYNAVTSPVQAKEVMDKLQALVWEQLPVITLSQSRLYAAWSPELKGYDGFYRVFWNSWLKR